MKCPACGHQWRKPREKWSPAQLAHRERMRAGIARGHGRPVTMRPVVIVERDGRRLFLMGMASNWLDAVKVARAAGYHVPGRRTAGHEWRMIGMDEGPDAYAVPVTSRGPGWEGGA